MGLDNLKKEIRLLLHPYFVANYFLISLYFITKLVPFICPYLYETCSIEVQEYEMLTFLGCIVAFKKKREVTITNFLAWFCMFAKVVNVLMFLRTSNLYAIIYLCLWLLQAVFLQQPVYRGPDKIVYFGEKALEEEVLKGDPRITWLVAFYASWSPACITFAPIFAEMSEQYGRDNLRFGKLDVARCPNEAVKFKIDTSSWSKQLPTVILFQGGKESDRRPGFLKGKVQKFSFEYENLVNAFGLNEIYAVCKRNPIGKKKNKGQGDKESATKNKDE